MLKTQQRFESLEQGYKEGRITQEQLIGGTKKYKNELQAQEKELTKLGGKVTHITTLYNKMNKAMSAAKTGKGSAAGSAGQAIQELGRGIADFNAVGGWTDFSRGAIASTNNIERMVEVFGYTIRQSKGLKGAIRALGQSLMGPAGVVFAITIALQVIPKLVEWFNKGETSAKDLTDSMKKLNEEILKQQGMKFDPLEATYEEVRKHLEGVNQEITRLEAKEGSIVGAGQGATYVYKLSDAERERLEFLKGQRAEAMGLIQDGKEQFVQSQKQAEEDKKRREQLKAQREEMQRQKEIQQEFLDDHRKLMAEVQGIMDEQDIFDEALKEAAGNIGPQNPYFGKEKIENVDNVLVMDEDVLDMEEELNDILRERKSIYADLTEAQAMNLAETLEGLEDQKVGWNDVADAAVGAFETAFSGDGTFLENLAKGIFQTLGSLAIKEGSFYVAAGIAKNIAAPGSGTKEVVGGSALIAAGAAIKAGANALSGSGGKKGKGRTVDPSTQGTTSSAVSTNSDTRNNADGGQPIAIARIKGQDLELAIQNANYSRRGYLPT